MIALIAGTGQLPLRACSTLIEQKKPFVVISLFPEDNADALTAVCEGSAEVMRENYYSPSSIIQDLKARSCSHLFFIGKVDKRNLLKHIGFDRLALNFLAKLAFKGDRDIMQAAMNLFEEMGFSILRQDEVLGGLFVKPGCIAGTVNDEIMQTAQMGIKKAQELSAADIGQSVVIKSGMIIAVEAIEGTDACLKRAIELTGGGVMLCKTAHKNHNTQYDLPTLGPSTLKGLSQGAVSAIVWEARTTLIHDLETFKRDAQALNITLLAL